MIRESSTIESNFLFSVLWTKWHLLNCNSNISQLLFWQLLNFCKVLPLLSWQNQYLLYTLRSNNSALSSFNLTEIPLSQNNRDSPTNHFLNARDNRFTFASRRILRRQWHLFSGDDRSRVSDALCVVMLLKSGAAMFLYLGQHRRIHAPYVVNSSDVYSTCVPLNSAARIWYNWMHRARWTPCWAWTNSRQATDLSPPPSAVLFSHLCASPILLSIPLLLSRVLPVRL